MANLDITNVDIFSLETDDDAVFRDDTLTFAGADTFAKGTILARRLVATAVTASAVSGGGNGTVTVASVVTGLVVPIAGVYTLTCITAVANGGVWKLTDPNGAIVADNLVMTAGAGAATVFVVGGLTFTITDAGTDFSAGATATLTVVADGKLVAFDPTLGGGVQTPCAVLTYAVTKAGSGDVPVRVMVGGNVNKNRLVIKSGASITSDNLDRLRARSIIAIDTAQLAGLDNQ